MSKSDDLVAESTIMFTVSIARSLAKVWRKWFPVYKDVYQVDCL